MWSKKNLNLHEKEQSVLNIEVAQIYHFLFNNNQMETLKLKNIITKKEKKINLNDELNSRMGKTEGSVDLKINQ